MKSPLWLMVVAGFLGCQALPNPEYFEQDPDLQSAAFQLADDYFNAVKAGESLSGLKKKFGYGAETLGELAGHECRGVLSWMGKPAISWQAEFKKRAVSEEISQKIFYTLALNYFTSLRKSGDAYAGLRIETVAEGRQPGF